VVNALRDDGIVIGEPAATRTSWRSGRRSSSRTNTPTCSSKRFLVPSSPRRGAR